MTVIQYMDLGVNEVIPLTRAQTGGEGSRDKGRHRCSSLCPTTGQPEKGYNQATVSMGLYWPSISPLFYEAPLPLLWLV